MNTQKTTAGFPGVKSGAVDLAGKSNSLRFWSGLGLFWALFMGYVVISWATSDYIGRTPVPEGVDVPQRMRIGIDILQILLPSLLCLFTWRFIVKPIIKTGQISTDGMLLIAGLLCFFWDPAFNFIQLHAGYNSYAFNLGFWTAEIPGWMSPLSERLPEPLIAWFGGYPSLLLIGIWFCVAIMRRVKRSYPQISNFWLSVIGVFSGMVFDLLLENILIRGFGLFAYIGAVQSLSIGGGHWYQFPLYEAFFFGGWWGCCSLLLYFKDDKGLSFVERGIENNALAKRSNFYRGLLRTLAIMGFVLTTEFFLYACLPQIIVVNGDPFPEDTPAYFINGMCGEGTPYACPRPELPINRREDQIGVGRLKFEDTLLISPEEAAEHLAKIKEVAEPLSKSK